jgi:hypothetical protein
MLVNWISERILNGFELLETPKSMTRTQWKLNALIAFHGNIGITSLWIMEKSPIFRNPIDQSTMSLEKNPSGDPFILFQKDSFPYSKHISRKYLTQTGLGQGSHQEVHLSSSFQSLMAEVCDGV